MHGLKSKKHTLKREPSKRRREENVQTLGVAAVRLHLPLEIVRTAKHMGCDAFKQSGRVNLPELQQWLHEHPELVNNSADMVGVTKENFLRAKADREMREHRLAVMRRDVIPVAEVRLSFTRATHEMKRKLLDGVRTLAQQIGLMGAMNEDQISKAMEMAERCSRDVLTDFAKNEWCELQ